MAPGQDSDPDLGQQRAGIEDVFRERWVPLPAAVPLVLTEPACAEARKALAQDRRTWLDHAIVQAVRDGVRPGDPLPSRQPGTYFDRGTDTGVFIIGSGQGRRVAVEFSHKDFPRARFGHRFEPDPTDGRRQAARLIEQIEAGALHQMVDNPPVVDGAHIIWTTWGTPNTDQELEHQRAGIESAFRHGWRPAGAGGPLPPRQAIPYIRGVTNTEVIITGRGLGRCVAVLFSYEHFPAARFGHRFPLDPFAEDREQIWLMEHIETGSVHRMMRDQPAADEAGIIWTTWGSPDLGQHGAVHHG